MLIHEFLNKDPHIGQDEAPLNILDSKYDVCLDNNCKNTKHIRHIERIMHFVSIGEKCKMHKIGRFEGGL